MQNRFFRITIFFTSKSIGGNRTMDFMKDFRHLFQKLDYKFVRKKCSGDDEKSDSSTRY